MKVKDVMKVVEELNELRGMLGLDKAYVTLFIDDVAIEDEEGHEEFHTLNELVLAVKREYVPDFWMELLKVDFVEKTYGNTLGVELTTKRGTHKVELFIDC